jgi:hypothetical protein
MARVGVSAMEEICDVLVIGGGPAGSTIAALLDGGTRQWRALRGRCHRPRYLSGQPAEAAQPVANGIGRLLSRSSATAPGT